MQTSGEPGKQRTKGDPKSDYERMLGGFCNCNCSALFILGWWMLYCAFKAYLAIDVILGMSDDKWDTASCMTNLTIDGTIFYDECCIGNLNHPFYGSEHIAIVGVNCDEVKTVYIIALVDSFC